MIPILLAIVVANPSFEFGLSGWSAYHGATLTRVAGGADGLWACQATGTGDFGIDDSPALVRTTIAGTSYVYSCWVRGVTGKAEAQLREYQSGVKVGATVLVSVALSGAWQKLSATIVAGRNGSQIDFQTRAKDGATTFQVDAISVTDGPVPPQPTQRLLVWDAPSTIACDGTFVSWGDSLGFHVLYVGPQSKALTKKVHPRDSIAIAAPTLAGAYTIYSYLSSPGGVNGCVSTDRITVPAPTPALYGRPAIMDLEVQPR